MISQIGQFFLFIGLIGLLIFFATDQVHNPAYGFCCGGFLSVLLGVLMIWRTRRPPPTEGRFRILRWLRGRRGKKKEEEKE
jgi:membrane-bound metal-dependent hydrolase YbcI (DUF457 family)